MRCRTNSFHIGIRVSDTPETLVIRLLFKRQRVEGIIDLALRQPKMKEMSYGNDVVIDQGTRYEAYYATGDRIVD